MSELAYGSITISDLTDGVSYYVESSVQAILQNAPTQSELVDSNGNNIIDSNGNLIIVQGSSFLPSSITFYAKTRTGKNSPTAYNGRFLIEESEDGVEWIAQYTSSKDESEHDYVPISDDMRYIRCTLYESGGGASLYSQTIMVINEPKTLKRIDNYYRITDSATAPTSGWSKNPTTIPTPTELLPYLWTYQEQYYSDGSIVTVRPTIIAKYGCSIRSIETWYIQKTSGVTPELDDPDWRTYLVAYVKGKDFWSKLRYYYDDYTGDSGLYFEADPVLEDSRDYAVEQNDAARDMANDYNEIILATNQHFWWDSNGAHVSYQSQKDYDLSPLGPNMLQNANGIQIRDGNTALSQFSGSGVQIGNVEKNHSIYNADGAYWYRPTEETPYMRIQNGVISDSLGSGMVQVTPSSTDNPQNSGWYEKNGAIYNLTEDVTVQSGKNYYQATYLNYWDFITGKCRWGDNKTYVLFNGDTLDISAANIRFRVPREINDDGYYVVTPSVGANPKQEGWYEFYSGAYHLTNDTTVDEGKIYFALVGGDESIAYVDNSLINVIDGINTDISTTQTMIDGVSQAVNQNYNYLNGGWDIATLEAHTISNSDGTALANVTFDQSTFLSKVAVLDDDSKYVVVPGKYIFTYMGNGWQLSLDDTNNASVNLLPYDAVSPYTSLSSGEVFNKENYLTDGSVIYTRPATTNKGFYVTNHALMRANTGYVLKFYMQKSESSVSDIQTFYLFSNSPNNIAESELYIDGIKLGSAINTEYPIGISDNNMHEVIIKFISSSIIESGTYLGLILQLNKNVNTAYTVNIVNLKWEINNHATAWCPPPTTIGQTTNISEYGISQDGTLKYLDNIVVLARNMMDIRTDIDTINRALLVASDKSEQMESDVNSAITTLGQDVSNGFSQTTEKIEEIGTGLESTVDALGRLGGTVATIGEGVNNILGMTPKLKAIFLDADVRDDGFHVYGYDINTTAEEAQNIVSAEVHIQPDRITFRKGNNAIAWIGDENKEQEETSIENESYKLYIPKAEVSDEVRIGDLGFIPRTNGNMCLKFVGGDDALGWHVNSSSFGGGEGSYNGRCYFYGYDAEGEPKDRNGYVYWDNKRIIIPKGYAGANPNSVAPFNTVLYVVYRISNSTFYNAWLEGSTWYGTAYSSSGSPGTKSLYTWDEATDIVLGYFVLPSAEGVITNYELYRPVKRYSDITTS